MESQIEAEIENLMNLRHPLIATPIGFVTQTAGEFKVARLYAAGGSLAEILRASPLWWTPTMKSKTVVGIVLALRFAHSLGLIHGGLKSSNVLFDNSYRVLVADFAPIGYKRVKVTGIHMQKLGDSVGMTGPRKRMSGRSRRFFWRSLLVAVWGILGLHISRYLFLRAYLTLCRK
jgi:serine/threonine protein kinase